MRAGKGSERGGKGQPQDNLSIFDHAQYGYRWFAEVLESNRIGAV